MNIQTTTQAETHSAPLKTWTPADGVKVIPLALETRSHVSTEEANGNPSAQAGRKHTSTEAQADLFSTVPEPLSSLPNPGTQARRVLELLATGEQPDHAEWYERAGSWRLAAHIGKLVHDFGWPVQTREISAPTAHCPGRTIARYWLPQNDMMRARVALRAGDAA